MLSFSNCADTASGFMHDLEGAVVTKELLDNQGNVVFSEVENLTSNVRMITFNINQNVALTPGVHRLRITYDNHGFKQIFTKCNYVVEEC